MKNLHYLASKKEKKGKGGERKKKGRGRKKEGRKGRNAKIQRSRKMSIIERKIRQKKEAPK